jgi:glycosyltransferase 2 family protein
VKKRTYWNVVKYVLALGLLAWVIVLNWDPNDRQGLKFVYESHVRGGVPLRYGSFVLAVVSFLTAVVLTFCRWYVLVRALDLPFHLSEAVRLGSIGFFFNTFLPGSVGGDIVKTAILARQQSQGTLAVASVLIDRVIGVWTLVAFASLLSATLWVSESLKGDAEQVSAIINIFGGLMVGICVLIWVGMVLSPNIVRRFSIWLSHLPRIGKIPTEFSRAVLLYRHRPRSILIASLLSVVSHVGFVLTFYLCSLTLLPPNGENGVPSLLEHFLIVPTGLVIRALPIFPGGVGIGEAGFGELYRCFGFPSSRGVQAALVYRFVSWLLGLIGYLIYLHKK